MLRTGQPSTYSRHTDYYQLWLENKKEIQKLESNLLDSKKIIRTLHLKLTDILKSIKIFEENQDLNNSNEVGTQRAQQQLRRNTMVSAETKRIALKRISQGESQTKIAKELGVVQSTVAYWVKTIGKDCSPDVEEKTVERNLDPEFIVSDGQSSSFSEQYNPTGITSKRTFRTQDNQEELQSGLKLTGIECSNLDFITPDAGSGQHSSFSEQGQASASENFNFKNVDFSVFSSRDVTSQAITAYDAIMVLNNGTEGRLSVLPDNIGELLIRDFNKAIQSKNSEAEATCQEIQPLSILANPSHSLCSLTPVEAKEDKDKDKNVKNLQRKQERTPKRKCSGKFSGLTADRYTRQKNWVSAEIKLMALERLSKGESQQQIAKDFGVGNSTVSYWVKTVGQNSSFSKEDQRSERNLDSEFIVSSEENSTFPEQRARETLSGENPEDVTLLVESVKQPIELGGQSHVSTKNSQVPLQRLNDATEADAVEQECSHCHNRFIYTGDVSGHPSDTLLLLCGTCKMQTKTITPHLEKRNKNMCSLCGKCFPYPSTLQVHQRRHLVRNRHKPHVCTFCGKDFSRIWHLNRHIQLHTSS